MVKMKNEMRNTFPGHYFNNIITGGGGDKDPVGNFTLYAQSEGLNHLDFDPIPGPPSNINNSLEHPVNTAELLLNHGIENFYIFPDYIGLKVYCYMYKEGLNKTKFFTYDGLLLEFEITEDNVASLYFSLLRSVKEIYDKIQWDTLTSLIIKGVITPYFNLTNVMPFGNIFDDIFDHEDPNFIQTVSVIDSKSLKIKSLNSYLSSDYFDLGKKLFNYKKDNLLKFNLNDKSLIRPYLAAVNHTAERPIRRFGIIRDVFQLGKNSKFLDKLDTDFTGYYDNSTLEFKPLHVVKYLYMSNPYKEKCQLVFSNLKNVIASPLYGEHVVVNVPDTDFKLQYIESALKDKLKDYSELPYSQGILIVPISSSDTFSGLILRNKSYLSILYKNHPFNLDDNYTLNPHYDRLLKYFKTLNNINNTILNLDLDDITLFNPELPGLFKRYCTSFASATSLLGLSTNRIISSNPF